MKQSKDQQKLINKVDRFVTVGFGLFFIAIAIVLLAESGSTNLVGKYAVLGGLGADAVVSAIRNRRSLLSRIGPLP
jgi:hypothetical protein